MCEVSSWSLMFATALLLMQATFQSPRLVESSGVAVSRAHPGVLWTHNDSGDAPYLECGPCVTIYAIPEPAPPERTSDTLGTTRAPAVLRLRYPDGSHDVEAVYVSPRDTGVYLVSKGSSGGTIRLYRVERSAWRSPDT